MIETKHTIVSKDAHRALKLFLTMQEKGSSNSQQSSHIWGQRGAGQEGHAEGLLGAS